ncbi:MAG: ABC transporter ATP-binding protein/permease [Spirochaetaceae bacterium]|nr:ABC transporter ATP-binding protein/permease [Spirochaetaceae bacterium]
MKQKFSSISIISPYLKKYRKNYILGFLCLIIVDAAQMLIPQYIKNAVNIISSDSFSFKSVLIIALLMTGTMLIIAFGRFLWRNFIHGSSRRVEALLRERLFTHILKMPQSFYQRNKTGGLMARFTNDIGAVRMAIGWGLVGLIDGSIMAISILVIIFIQSGKTAFFAVLPLPVITVLIVIFNKMIGKRYAKAQAAYSATSEAVQETFAGIRVIKSFVKENFFIKRFSALNDDYKAANVSLVKTQGFFLPLAAFFAASTQIIVILLGGRLVILGDMSGGEFVALFSYLQMLIWPVYGAGFTIAILQRGLVSLKRISEILNEAPAIRDEPSIAKEDGKRFEEGRARGEPFLSVRGLSFSYGEGPEILRGVNLTIKEGEWIGVLGRTGSGKSTLIKCFSRLVNVPRNSVFVYGTDVNDAPLKTLRGLFAISPQDSGLFSGSIKENILYGLSPALGGDENVKPEEDALRRAIETSALGGDLANFSGGENAIIGERGVTLSGGQKQRVSIARAAITDRQALILDDSLSAVDAETESRILTQLYKERKGKTTIIISHRISAFRHADFIAVLENGRITESGTRSELLKKGGYFAKTARIQQLPEEF